MLAILKTEMTANLHALEKLDCSNKKKKVRKELARGGEKVIGNAVGCERIQTRTEHAKILTNNDGGDARRINFNHYIVDSKLTTNLEAEPETEKRL